MENGAESIKEGNFLSRMALNDNKAGMEGLDRDKINKIIMDTSKGSRFYESELKREQQVNQRIEKMMLQKAQITEQQLKKAQTQVDKMVSELEKTCDLSRVIVHVDMDAFYAAVEMRDCPELKERPMAVGSMSMLSTSNYHARKYGVRAAMPGFIAKKLCPDLVIVPPNFNKYRAVSDEIREIFSDYDPHFQPMSLDEAYLDFTAHLEQRQSWPESSRTHRYRSQNEKQTRLHQEAEVTDLSPVLFEDSPTSSPSLPGSGGSTGGAFEVFGTSVEEAVREMRFRIEQKTTLTASAGIAPNTMLAKVCSDKNKPNGQFRLLSTRGAVMDFIQDLPVRKICGIGKVNEKMLKALGITTCSHLQQQMALLSLLFSETSWHYFMQISLGLGSTHIPRHEERKSMSTERTFKELSKPEEQFSLCRKLCEDLAEDLKKEGLKGKTVTLKLKNVNFEVKTRAQTLPYPVATAEDVFAVAKDLLKMEIENESPQPLRLRLMGVRISAFISVDDKTPMQKSILGFLQPGKPLGHLEVQNSQKPKEISLGRRPTEEEPQQSFFQRAHAKRLQLMAANSSRQDEGCRDESSMVNLALSKEDVEPSTQPRGDDCADLDFSENKSASPVQPQASTSSCRTQTEALTCPVCFKQVRTADLNVFNRHIDSCLSEAAGKPNRVSGAEFDLETEHQKSKTVHKQSREVEELPVNGEELSRSVPQEDSPKNNSVPKVLLSEHEQKPVTLQGHQSGPVLICPVCYLTQETDDLTIFNRHVDLCLNQEVLHELRGQTTLSIKPSVGKNSKGKRVTDTPSFPPSKKPKSLGVCNTIDKFFR
uniref:DNA polymerase kappa n=1 Tax=Nothobranchius furzeri TaxID=105023 RepID=A0A8C6P4X0_NOTFU